MVAATALVGGPVRAWLGCLGRWDRPLIPGVALKTVPHTAYGVQDRPGPFPGTFPFSRVLPPDPGSVFGTVPSALTRSQNPQSTCTEYCSFANSDAGSRPGRVAFLIHPPG